MSNKGAMRPDQNPDHEAMAERLRTAFDLFDLGIKMLRARLRREGPKRTPEEIDELVNQWLQRRRGAEFGDGDGRPGTWPRRVG